MSRPTAQHYSASFRRSCLSMLLLVVGTWFGLYWLLRHYVETPFQFVLPVIGGSVALFGFGLLAATVRALKNRRLLAQAQGSGPPNRSGRAAFEGVIEPLDQPLAAPFSGADCVACEYQIFERVVSESSEGADRTSEVTYYDGMHLAPARIRTAWGEVKLLSFPHLDDFHSVEGSGEAGRAFLERTRFEVAGKGPGKLRQALDQISEVMADDDGAVNLDVCVDTPPDPRRLVYRETIVPVGTRVCAIGRYDRARGGLVPDPKHGGAVLHPGSAAEVLPRLSGHLPSGVLFMILGLGSALAPLAPAPMLEHLDGPGEWLLDYRLDNLRWEIQEQNLPAIDRWLRVGVGEDRLSLLFSGIYLHRNWDITRRLIAAGADPDARNQNGRTQLMRANANYARALLAWGADPNARDPRGYTPLMFAIGNLDAGETARLLLDAGADPSLRNDAGQSAYDLVRTKPPGWLDEDLVARLGDF